MAYAAFSIISVLMHIVGLVAVGRTSNMALGVFSVYYTLVEAMMKIASVIFGSIFYYQTYYLRALNDCEAAKLVKSRQRVDVSGINCAAQAQPILFQTWIIVAVGSALCCIHLYFGCVLLAYWRSTRKVTKLKVYQ